MPRILAQAVAATVSLFVTVCALADCPGFEPGLEIGTVENDDLDEISGIAASRKNTEVIWAHNDAGGGANAWAMDTQGRYLGIYPLVGASNNDWEDIAIGPGPVNDVDYIYLGDIGDNDATRPNVTIYRVPEPQVNADQEPVYQPLNDVEAIVLKYPDGARNAEAMLVDPITKDIYIFSKEHDSFNIYRAGYPQSTISTSTMEYKGIAWWYDDVSSADISPKGDMIIVRNDKDDGSLYLRPQGTNLWDAFAGTQCYIPIESENNGEAISFDSDGCGYYTTSEGRHEPIFYFARDGLCPEIPCDFDGSGAVDFNDLVLLFDNWTLNDPVFDVAPPGGDGTIDLLDLAFCSLYWQE